jgi:hypothetical protein
MSVGGVGRLGKSGLHKPRADEVTLGPGDPATKSFLGRLRLALPCPAPVFVPVCHLLIFHCCVLFIQSIGRRSFFLPWVWDLNSGLRACKAGALLWIFWSWGLW